MKNIDVRNIPQWKSKKPWNSRLTKYLDPHVEVQWLKLVNFEKMHRNIDLMCSSTVRNQAQQTMYFKEGTGIEFLGAHVGFAIDFFINRKGDIYNHAMMDQVIKDAKVYGFECGADWAKEDRPHLEMTGGLTYTQLRAGERPKFAPDIVAKSKLH